MPEAQSAKAPNKQRTDVTVVTPDNFNDFVAGQKPAAVVDPEVKAKEELAKVEAEKKARLEAEAKAKKAEEAEEDIDHPDEEKKGRLNQRFSDLTAKRKEAEAKAEKIAAEKNAERVAREKAEQERDALRAKYEPPKSEELGPEPLASQFTDVNEYGKALKDWTAEKTRKEDATKASEERQAREQAATAKAWQERQEAFRKENPDYDKTIAESDVKVSDQVKDAILDSDVGPQILHHLAKNTDIAARIGEMTVSRALKEVGKLEAKFTKDAPAAEAPKTPLAEISKAPPPITPLRNASSPVVKLSGNDDVPQSMTYEDWKALRKAGKIK